MEKMIQNIIRAIESRRMRNSDRLKWLATFVKDGQIKTETTVEIDNKKVRVADILTQAWGIIEGTINSSLRDLNQLCEKILNVLFSPQNIVPA